MITSRRGCESTSPAGLESRSELTFCLLSHWGWNITVTADGARKLGSNLIPQKYASYFQPFCSMPMAPYVETFLREKLLFSYRRRKIFHVNIYESGKFIIHLSWMTRFKTAGCHINKMHNICCKVCFSQRISHHRAEARAEARLPQIRSKQQVKLQQKNSCVFLHDHTHRGTHDITRHVMLTKINPKALWAHSVNNNRLLHVDYLFWADSSHLEVSSARKSRDVKDVKNTVETQLSCW